MSGRKKNEVTWSYLSEWKWGIGKKLVHPVRGNETPEMTQNNPSESQWNTYDDAKPLQ